MKFFQMCIGRSLRLLVCTLVGIHGMASGQTDPVITAFGIVDGRVQLGMDGAAGEYKAQCSTSLGTGPWLPLTRLLSDGSSQQIGVDHILDIHKISRLMAIAENHRCLVQSRTGHKN